MKKLMITAAALMVACAAYGQGAFLFNTHDTTAGNVVNFTFNGAAASGSDLFVQVWAGPNKDITTMTALTPILALDNTGTKAGYTDPLLATYTVPGMGNGTAVWVAYQGYEGTSLASAIATSPVMFSTAQVALAEPPSPPNEVALGTQNGVAIGIVPEPTTLALGLLGLGTLLAIRRRK
jgi:MYXO-CTERM domain-containing protein